MSSFEKHAITADSALVALQGAAAKARQLGHAMSLAVTDDAGVVAASLRMDGASEATLKIAEDKAYTSASLSMATHALWDMIKNDPPLQYGFPSLPRMVVFGGGYPIVQDGRTIGAIGVSGGHYSDDMEVARAGLSAIGAPVT
ncbi:MAG: heme-binding protein [Pseudomonadota bacterium]